MKVTLHNQNDFNENYDILDGFDTVVEDKASDRKMGKPSLTLPSPRRRLLLALRRSRRSRRPALRQDARRLYPSAQHPLPSRALVARRGRQRCQLRACRLLLTFAPVHRGADPLAPPPLFRHPHLYHPPRPATRGRLARECRKEMVAASHRHRRAAARRRQQCAGVFVERVV